MQAYARTTLPDKVFTTSSGTIIQVHRILCIHISIRASRRGPNCIVSAYPGRRLSTVRPLASRSAVPILIAASHMDEGVAIFRASRRALWMLESRSVQAGISPSTIAPASLCKVKPRAMILGQSCLKDAADIPAVLLTGAQVRNISGTVHHFVKLPTNRQENPPIPTAVVRRHFMSSQKAF